MKFDRNNFFYQSLSGSDREEMLERTKFRRGYRLLKRIFEELNPQEFSLAEIMSMNANEREVKSKSNLDKIIRF